MVELVVRLAFSLAVVLGLLTLLTRISAKRFRGSTDAPIRVVHRQALSRGSAVAVVSVGSRVLVIGTTEQQVSLLTELDPDELELDDVEQAHQVDEPVSTARPPAIPAARAHLEPVDLVSLQEDVRLDDLLGRPDELDEELLVGLAAPPAPSLTASSLTGEDRSARNRRALRATTASQGVLAGSALSAQTWRQAFTVATRKQQDAS